MEEKLERKHPQGKVRVQRLRKRKLRKHYNWEEKTSKENPSDSLKEGL
jgi:hypothetical protein